MAIGVGTGDQVDAVSTPLIRAAQYVRKSTDHQKYSIENQSDANLGYARRRGMEIIRTYADDGISGLTFEGRDGLQQLIDDVQSGNVDFAVILVFDVSRWGRFQDVDESAYYEHICKRAGICVHYCAEQFANDGSLVSTIVKNIKRAMAGEYSRELSVKVFAGQKRLVTMGFRVSGVPGYGLRRLLIDQNGAAKGELAPRQWKSISTDRVILIPGPPEEIEVVRWIYAMFVHQRAGASQIARQLNARKIATPYGHPWTGNLVLQILRNEKYIGNNVWNRESFKLRQVKVRNGRELWVRADGAFEAIVDRALFDAAQAVFEERSQSPACPRPLKYSNAELLDRLRRLLSDYGDLSRRIIKQSDLTPSPALYDARFGSLSNAYRMIGFTPNRNGYGPKIKDRVGRRPRPGHVDEDLLETLRRLHKEHGYLTGKIITNAKGVPSANTYCLHFGSLRRAYQLIGFTPDPARTRALRSAAGRRATDAALLDSLRELLHKRGQLSAAIIDEDKTIPCAVTYENRFGCLMNAYRLIGYTPERFQTRYRRPEGLSDDILLEALRRLWRKRGHLSEQIIGESNDVPSYRTYYVRFGGLTRPYELIGFDPRPRRR
jgi:DNA invertase Pin-like site-specific DNA recombinase